MDKFQLRRRNAQSLVDDLGWQSGEGGRKPKVKRAGSLDVRRYIQAEGGDYAADGPNRNQPCSFGNKRWRKLGTPVGEVPPMLPGRKAGSLEASLLVFNVNVATTTAVNADDVT